ncbi:hypothetical protein OAI40_03245 [Candidatus Pseudothioglobus singularis]|nr:hypothetical protein [Candidatus Pseudothioglobus singularis]MDB4598212.1 hypothetical protein [Candidatus Pseudothioglobus singularis]|tara:strand:+ start:874 stop:1452 length:579 start_codon:yes stop_codon:yes gene_type:complete
MKPLIISFLFLSLFTQVYAHKPVLNENSTYPPEAPYEIEEPEISKAIYSTLTGDPHYYRIQSDIDFDFYAGILAAKIGECALDRKFSFEVLDSEFHSINVADGENFEWEPWYEEYGKQWYWNGPEIGKNFLSDRVYKAGTYYIKVFNKTNTGQYIMAVGDIEKFSFTDIVGLLFSMGDIEDEYWDPSLCASS